MDWKKTSPKTPASPRSTPSSMVKKSLRFEESLAELEQLVDRMEQGNLPLEDALKLFERGIELSRNCQKALKEAEQKVQILANETAEPTLKPYDDADDT